MSSRKRYINHTGEYQDTFDYFSKYNHPYNNADHTDPSIIIFHFMELVYKEFHELKSYEYYSPSFINDFLCTYNDYAKFMNLEASHFSKTKLEEISNGHKVINGEIYSFLRELYTMYDELKISLEDFRDPLNIYKLCNDPSKKMIKNHNKIIKKISKFLEIKINEQLKKVKIKNTIKLDISKLTKDRETQSRPTSPLSSSGSRTVSPLGIENNIEEFALYRKYLYSTNTRRKSAPTLLLAKKNFPRTCITP